MLHALHNLSEISRHYSHQAGSLLVAGNVGGLVDPYGGGEGNRLRQQPRTSVRKIRSSKNPNLVQSGHGKRAGNHVGIWAAQSANPNIRI